MYVGELQLFKETKNEGKGMHVKMTLGLGVLYIVPHASKPRELTLDENMDGVSMIKTWWNEDSQ